MSEQNNQREFDDSLLSAYVDGELTSEERTAVEARLADDPQARQLVADLEAVSARVRSLPRAEVAGDIRAAVMDQIAESKATVPPSDLSMPRRLLWPLLATAALVMLMIYQTEVKENELEVAQIDKLEVANGEEKAKDESSARAIPEMKVLEEGADADAFSPPVLRDGSTVEGLAAAPTEDHLGLERGVAADVAAPSPSIGRVAREGMSLESNVGLVHITLTDLRSGAEHFDRLLLSNDIQLVDEIDEAESSPTATSDRAAAQPELSLYSDSRVGGFGGGRIGELSEVDSKSDTIGDKAASPAAEMVLVEAPPEQLANLLFACSQDTEEIESITIDEPTEAVSEAQREPFDQYRQYEKPSRDQQAKEKLVITPEQQGVIAALNSLNLERQEPSAGPASVGLPSQQAWATKLRSGQSSDDLKQIEGKVQSRLNQAYSSSSKQRKLSKEEAAQPQQMRVLFFLHPSPSPEK